MNKLDKKVTLRLWVVALVLLIIVILVLIGVSRWEQSRYPGQESLPSYLFYRFLVATGLAPQRGLYLPGLDLRTPDTVRLKAGETIEIPIEVRVRQEAPTDTELCIYVVREESRPEGGAEVAYEELPAGIRFTVIDDVKFEQQHTYRLEMRIEVSQGFPPGTYNFVITEIGGVEAYVDFSVKVMPS